MTCCEGLLEWLLGVAVGVCVATAKHLLWRKGTNHGKSVQMQEKRTRGSRRQMPGSGPHHVLEWIAAAG